MICSVQFTARPLVLVMHPGQRSALLATHPHLERRVLVLGDFDPEPIETREIADPWGGSAAAFDASYARVRRCVAALPLDSLR